jgi:dCMP deaminase
MNDSKYDKAHMEVARIYAKMSSAVRMQVGAIIVKEHKIISIGYNGMPSGWDNTCEYKVPRPQKKIYGSDSVVDMSFRYTLKTKPEVLHAETNAIAKVAKSNESSEGATLYTTCAPCLDCAKLIYQAGIRRVVYAEEYLKGDAGLEFLKKCSIDVDKI